MSTPLQDFTPDKSSYERPTLPWVCGRIPEGCPCHIGPSISGDCQAGLECIPYRDGDGFVCARPPAWGGTCETGPLPDGKCCQTVVLCQPRRSIRMRRQIISVCCVGLILGLLLLITGSDSASRDAFISPGELTLQHHSSRQRCSDCHTNAELTLKRMDTAEGLPDIAIQDSLKCLACHDLGDTPFNPHALPIPELASLTDAAQDGGNTASTPWLISLARRFGTSPMQTGELACSRCHKEHRGRVSDLTQLADEQCQICHTHTFHSFASGHPEFDGFPYSRRTRIHFDHTTHYGTHFANFKRVMPHGERPANCGSCHTPDSDRRMMPVVGF
ncbi:MAG: hypothetical protein VB858_16405, partial [Planctomycetaceae bacterium]